ncbi:MAG: NTP transferase domain-containing protein, partial [Nitrospiraceae bacterium]|nr:NTP transferase domain-containing protein [Nitrospiraceae bacterium]
MSSSATIIPTILCGGSGTRLWPMSREQHPKQLLSLAGPKSLLQETVVRLDDLQGQIGIAPRPLVLCNEEYRFLIAEQLREINRGEANIILEPVGRNTAPALTLAALHAEKELAGRLLLVMPSDHVIADRAAFHSAVMKGANVA